VTLEHHALVNELPEYREMIHRLKLEDPEFHELFDAYHELDRRIYRIEQDIEPVEDELRTQLKRRRVLLKDRLYARLEEASRGGLVRPEAVRVECGVAVLDGDLEIPEQAQGLVVFVHGADSSRWSPRNRFVARALRRARLATLLFDLRTEKEAEADLLAAQSQLDVGRDAERLVGTIDWLGRQEPTRALPLGLFGAGSGGAAALLAAVRRPNRVGALVARGALLDRAAEALPRVRVPTLLVVGARDEPALALHRDLPAPLQAEIRLEIVRDAGPLFEAPGTLSELARLAAKWFSQHLASRPRS
jgi:uncharacterized protein YdcH (DUF465 family)/dienelactone hydrolase